MSFNITLQEPHLARLRALTLPPDGREGAALLLFGSSSIGEDPWSHTPARRLISRDVIAIAPQDFVSSSARHVTVRTDSLTRVLRRACEEGLEPGYVHAHPRGPTAFSRQDDSDEPLMAQMARNRNGRATLFVSLLTTAAGEIVGRVWRDGVQPDPVDLIRVVGERLQLHYPGRFDGTVAAAFHRQVLAFGPALSRDLSTLRFGVIGAGATGSATAVLLARLGARRIALFDPDLVDETNLSRLHGSTRHDVGRPKVDVLKQHIEDFGLGTEVVTKRAWIGASECRDALKSCDVILGCTDDHAGRLLLNRLAYFYAIPLLDMGIDIGLGESTIAGADARVTTVLPGTRCLVCRKVVDATTAYEEDLARRDPEEYARRLRERYVRGGGIPNPAVVHFTTSAATMAVDELLHRLTGYRRVGASAHRVRKFHLLQDKTPGPQDNPDCPICRSDQYWGRGDVQPFLDRVG